MLINISVIFFTLAQAFLELHPTQNKNGRTNGLAWVNLNATHYSWAQKVNNIDFIAYGKDILILKYAQ
jgi:hypothetical protein